MAASFETCFVVALMSMALSSGCSYSYFRNEASDGLLSIESIRQCKSASVCFLRLIIDFWAVPSALETLRYSTAVNVRDDAECRSYVAYR